MQRIVPNLWFDHNAAEAVDFYLSAFEDARVLHTARYPSEGLPEFQQSFAGDVLTVDFELGGTRFMAINAGPEFPVNPALSFMLNFDLARDAQARERLDALWAKLVAGGEVLMGLESYDFSPRYGWLQDRYGVSWQLILGEGGGDPRPFVMPSLLFGGAAQGRASEALEHYQSVFPDTTVGMVARYDEPVGPAVRGDIMYADLQVLGSWITVMDSGAEQGFTFGPGVSLAVECRDQAEIDSLWAKLSAVPQAEQCGWCVDRFGVSWQVVPADMADLMQAPGAYQRMLEMKKIDIAGLAS